MGYSAPKFPHRAVLFAALILYFLAFVHDRLINAASVWRPGLGLTASLCSYAVWGTSSSNAF
jgi:hypothetical protein